MRKKIYTPNDRMPYGKNKGLLLKEIYQYEPNYLEWLIINANGFHIDIEAFEKLPNPTPLATGAVTGSQTRKEIWKKQSSLFAKAALTDNINMSTNVRAIKESLKDTDLKTIEVRFRFSEEARKKNNITKRFMPEP